LAFSPRLALHLGRHRSALEPETAAVEGLVDDATDQLAPTLATMIDRAYFGGGL